MKQRYRVIRKGASHSFIAFFLALVGCSSTPHPEAPPIEVGRLQDVDCSEVNSSGEEINLYKCTLGEKEAFVFAIKDCSLPEPLTLSATTRKLIVGMLETKILEQQPTKHSSQPALRSLISGIMDATPILMSVYTVRQNSCIEDFIVWRPTDTVMTQTNSKTEVFKALSNAIFERASLIHGKD